MTNPEAAGPDQTDVVAAEELAADLLVAADARRSRSERARAARISRMLSSPDGLDLIMALTDEVLRIHEPGRAAAVLAGLVGDRAGPPWAPSTGWRCRPAAGSVRFCPAWWSRPCVNGSAPRWPG